MDIIINILFNCKYLIETGISIPSDYTSYITPISSTKLYNSVSSYKDIIHFETSYVVKFNKVCEISEPKPIWSFHHPNWNIDTNPGKYIIICG